jgi:hypothetical protein
MYPQKLFQPNRCLAVHDCGGIAPRYEVVPSLGHYSVIKTQHSSGKTSVRLVNETTELI